MFAYIQASAEALEPGKRLIHAKQTRSAKAGTGASAKSMSAAQRYHGFEHKRFVYICDGTLYFPSSSCSTSRTLILLSLDAVQCLASPSPLQTSLLLPCRTHRLRQAHWNTKHKLSSLFLILKSPLTSRPITSMSYATTSPKETTRMG